MPNPIPPRRNSEQMLWYPFGDNGRAKALAVTDRNKKARGQEANPQKELSE